MGCAYTMAMVDGHPQMAEVHDRMPLILAREDWPVWTPGGSAEARERCQTWPGEIAVERTGDLWAGGAYRPRQDQLL